MDFIAMVYLFSLGTAYPAYNAMSFLTTYVTGLPKNQISTVGYLQSETGWTKTKQSSSGLIAALHFVCASVFHIANVTTVRLGRGIKHFGKATGASRTLLIWWRDNIADHCTFETRDTNSFHSKDVTGDDWDSCHYMQFLMRNNTGWNLERAIEPSDGTSDISDDADASGRTDESDPDRLSTISEGVEDEALLVCPMWCDNELWQDL